jgi:hypothetical protein
MRRRRLLAALVGLAVVVTAGMFVLWPRLEPPSRITRENSDRIQVGMSRAEVEAILGPPGDYRNGPTNPVILGDLGEGTWPWSRPNTTCAEWVGDTGWLCVEFNNGDGTMRAGDFLERKRIAQHPLDNLLWRLKRQWHRWFPE